MDVPNIGFCLDAMMMVGPPAPKCGGFLEAEFFRCDGYTFMVCQSSRSSKNGM